MNLWFRLIGEMIAKPLPEASENLEPLLQPIEPEERKIWPWWKVQLNHIHTPHPIRRHVITTYL